MTTALLQPEGCLASAEHNAMDYVANSAGWQNLVCADGTGAEKVEQARKRIWLGEWNPEWVDQRPEPYEGHADDGDVFPLCVIDTQDHGITQGSAQIRPRGDVAVWLGLSIPEFWDGHQIARHQHNCRTYVTIHMGRIINDVSVQAAESAAFKNIDRFAVTMNRESDWEASGQFVWWAYSMSWGWQ